MSAQPAPTLDLIQLIDERVEFKLAERPAATDLPELVYNVDRLAEMFGVARKTVQKWHRAGLLESVAVTARDRVSTPEQVQAFLRKKNRSLRPN
jgi:hypothetical protein